MRSSCPPPLPKVKNGHIISGSFYRLLPFSCVSADFIAEKPKRAYGRTPAGQRICRNALYEEFTSRTLFLVNKYIKVHDVE
jgi:hypothetical protein